MGRPVLALLSLGHLCDVHLASAVLGERWAGRPNVGISHHQTNGICSLGPA